MTGRPPHMAQALLTAVLPKDERDIILGDLEEEFIERKAGSSEAAAWYWRQTLVSIPSFVLHRLRGRDGAQILFFLAAGFFGFVATTIWDAAIARRMAQSAGQMLSDMPIGALRLFYLFIQALGFALTGAIVATFLQNKSITGAPSARKTFTVVLLILMAPTLWTLLSGQDAYPLSFRLIWLGLSIAAFFTGAYVVVRYTRRR